MPTPDIEEARARAQTLLDEARAQRVEIQKRMTELDLAERLALALLDGLDTGEVVP
jgi:hypothetical protein